MFRVAMLPPFCLHLWRNNALRSTIGKSDRPSAHKSCLRICAIEQVSKGRGDGSGPSSQRAERAQATIDKGRKTGAKTIRVLSRKYKIRSLRDLKKALDEDKLQDIKGIGKKTLDTMRRYVTEHQSLD